MLWALIALCCVVELTLLAGDLELIPDPRLRQKVYEFAGFWPGLLIGWQPNYAAQPWLMFFTYGFLHGGPGHLCANMLTLWVLGRQVLEHVGARGFAVLYVGSILGGALGYAWLAQTPQPMVGASGALFGLAGALLSWAWRDRIANQTRPGALVQVALYLLAINLVMYWVLDGHLAWQTHLLGFVTGVTLARLWRSKTKDYDS